MQDGSQDAPRGIVPGGPAPRAVEPRVSHGTLMLVLGCIASLFLPFVGVLLIAYGMRELAEARGTRGLAIALLEGVGLAAVALVSNLGIALFLAPVLVCALAIVFCMWRGATVTNVSVAVVIAALACFGADAVAGASTGLSVRAVAVSYLMDGIRETVSGSIEGSMAVVQVEGVVEVIWPFTYVADAAFDALVAGIGSYLMHVRSAGVVKRPSLARFDAPLWSVGVLSICIVCLAASFTGFPEAGLLRTASATVLLSVRIIFACQGFGVMNALMSRKRLGCATRTVCIFVIFWIEMVFFLMSIIGLVDVWANFRKLPRDGSCEQEQH